eukprot:6194126-Pleurochrysis_carterae.AAC.1
MPSQISSFMRAFRHLCAPRPIWTRARRPSAAAPTRAAPDAEAPAGSARRKQRQSRYCRLEGCHSHHQNQHGHRRCRYPHRLPLPRERDSLTHTPSLHYHPMSSSTCNVAVISPPTHIPIPIPIPMLFPMLGPILVPMLVPTLTPPQTDPPHPPRLRATRPPSGQPSASKLPVVAIRHERRRGQGSKPRKVGDDWQREGSQKSRHLFAEVSLPVRASAWPAARRRLVCCSPAASSSRRGSLADETWPACPPDRPASRAFCKSAREAGVNGCALPVWARASR